MTRQDKYRLEQAYELMLTTGVVADGFTYYDGKLYIKNED